MRRAPADGEPLLRAPPALSRGSRWLVGVSGGADSVALLHLLNNLRRGQRIHFVVAHLDHQLRGAASAGDARFVQRLAGRLRLPCVVERGDVAACAAAHGWSLEQAAREARLDFFLRTARAQRAAGVLLAHTQDDQAETLLLRLMRGAGPQGLGGMHADSALRGLRILRPLLGCRRAALRDWLRARRLRWREDASNADERFLRNAVRRRVLPALQAAAGRDVAPALARAAALLADEQEHWTEALAAAAGRCAHGDGWSATALAREELAIQRRLLIDRLWSQTGGGDFEAVERVRALAAAGRGRADVGRSWFAVAAGGVLRFERAADGADMPTLPLRPGAALLDEARGLKIRAQWRRGGRVPRGGILLDAGHVQKAQLAIRAWRPGDRMRPEGGRGSRKLQDIFTDAKVPRSDRHRLPVLVADDAPVWVPGFRAAEGWRARRGAARALAVTIVPAGC